MTAARGGDAAARSCGYSGSVSMGGGAGSLSSEARMRSRLAMKAMEELAMSRRRCCAAS